MDISSAVQVLAQAIAGTREFQALATSRKEVRQNLHTAQLLAQFQEKQQTLHNPQQNLSQSQMQALAEEIERDFLQLNANPSLRHYFTASEQFHMMMDRITQDLFTALDKLM